MIQAVALPPLSEIKPGDDLAALLEDSLNSASITLSDSDVLVIAQKAISKAEGSYVDLRTITPSARALELATKVEKEPRLVEVILGETRSILRAGHGVLICETTHGFICANAGVDQSNAGEANRAILLPKDSDLSARQLRDQLSEALGVRPAVVIADSFGRAWRLGQVEVAIGCAGLMPLNDLKAQPDSDGRELEATVIAVADQIAAAADLARTKTSRQPAVIVNGAGSYVSPENGPGATALLRPEAEDLFR